MPTRVVRWIRSYWRKSPDAIVEGNFVRQPKQVQGQQVQGQQVQGQQVQGQTARNKGKN